MLIVDPNNYDKRQVFEQACVVVRQFLSSAGIVQPVIHDHSPRHARNRWQDYGLCDASGNIYVNVKRSRVPVKVPGFAWSYTGYKSDLTAPGILAHEVGHHVHFQLEKRLGRKEIFDKVVEIRKFEHRVSSYEPNSHETVAEAMRLFILNPELLKEGRPLRWLFLTEFFGLQPMHNVPWRDVLRYAHPRLIEAADRWSKVR